ncbi:HAD hydrolase family protein [Leptospira interrogans]|uniref:HAD hydrolase family protein n=1 Tax=Leptospira interrogans TaxID=173 RepID=UPI003AAFE82F
MFYGDFVSNFFSLDSILFALFDILTSFSRVRLNRVVAIGDGANDSLMLNEAGIGIGFHAKEGLKKQIVNWIDFAPMDVLLFLFP